MVALQASSFNVRQLPTYSCTPFMVGEIDIPWSDGHRRYWPAESGPHDQASRGYHSRADLTDDASIQWRTKLGTELARVLVLPSRGTGSYVLKDWPDGYALFIHHKGSRKDKYLYGLSEGRYFRSAAEFLPHAIWLMKGGTEPSTSCSCRFCSKLRVKSTGTTSLRPASPRFSPSSISQTLPGVASEEPASGPPSPSSTRSTGDKLEAATSPQTPTDGVRRSKRLLVKRNPETVPIQASRATAYYIRIQTPVTISTSSGNRQPPAEPWPVLHELAWCRLQKPIESSSTAIEFWPGVIKSYEERSPGTIFHVSLVGNRRDIPFTIDRLLPYQAYRMEGNLVQELHRHAAGNRRITLVDLEKAIGTKLDDTGFSIISSTCIFAIEFCQRLSAVWSCTADPEIRQPSPDTHRPRRREKSGSQTPQNSWKKEYKTLWWGPERIRPQQVVRLKISTSAIHLDRKVLNVRSAPGVKGSGATTLAFLKIHSIFSESREDVAATTPLVSGLLFGLISEFDRKAHGSNEGHSLPSPPKDHVFFPLLKEGFEVVVPITFIGGRYYPDIPGKGAIQGSSPDEARLMALVGLACSADSTICPTVYKVTRAQMVEYAFKEGKRRAEEIIYNTTTHPE